MSILTCENVTLQLDGRRILHNLSLDLWEGHIHAVVGPNGAGKSTFASMVMGLDGYRNYSGNLTFRNQALDGLSVDERARLGITLAWQEPARFEGLSVSAFIRAAAQKPTVSRIEEVLDTVGLDPRRYMERALDKTLSGGERKRIELASIMAMEPSLVLLDEPDSGIDVEALQKIFALLNTLKNQGATVVLITHSLTVLRQAEHAFLFCDGQVLDKGTVDHVESYFRNRCIGCEHPNQPEDGEPNEQ
ncbi:MAG: ATP-binding cassette domain-containing protein [Verrucomicrobiota bacterium]